MVCERVVECVDNDETAAVITTLVEAKTLIILTSVDGIYKERGDASTLIREISGATPEELDQNAQEVLGYCQGASRQGAGGAAAKLMYSLGPAKMGTDVYISSADNRIDDILSGKARSTHIFLR